MIKYGIITVFLCILSQVVKGQESREEIEKLKIKALGEIEYANQILEETQGKKEASLNDLKIISHLIEKRKEYVREMENESHEITLLISENTVRNELILKQITEIKNNYERIIINEYKNRRRNYLLMYILAAENINQAYKRLRYNKIYRAYQKREIETLEKLNKELDERNKNLEALYKEKEENIKNTNEENNKIKEEANNKNIVIERLKRREKELKEEIKSKEAIAKKLEEQLKAIIEEESRRAGNELLETTLTPEERVISDEFVKNKGKLPWPTSRGIVTGTYGENDYPDYKSVKIIHGGIHISTVSGTEVYAIFEGKVSEVFRIPGENYTVLIKHGEYYTVYHNLINVKVTKGQKINAKQLIGNVYTDNVKGESILYFQVWKEIEAINPEEWLSSEK